MAWQDELRRLDEDLAAGRISADDHQRRRNELTAQADAERAGPPEQERGSGPPEQSRPPGPAGPPGPEGPPGQGSQQSPFPPAFRWDNTPNETTQVMNPVEGGDAERTQVVPNQPPPGPSYEDSESTQVVQAGPPSAPRYGPPSYSGGSEFSGGSDLWAQQESAPPWVSSDPIQEPSAGWMIQGPEFLEPEPKESKVMRIVAVAAAVVVLAGIAFGAWFLFGRDASSVAEPPQTQQQAPPVTTTEQPEDPLAPADIGGIREFKTVTSLRDVRSAGFLTTEELAGLEDAGAGQSRLLVTNFPEGKATILVAQVRAPAGAVTARQQLASLQVGYGFSARSGPPQVDSFELLDKGDVPPKLRAVYVSRGLVIRIEMAGITPGEDPSATTAKFEWVLAQQLQKLPADA